MMNNIGDYDSELFRKYEKTPPVHSVVGRAWNQKGDVKGELCYVRGQDIGQDPRYYYINGSGKLAVLGPTGLVESVYHYSRRTRRTTVLQRDNAYGIFNLGRKAASLEQELDAVYDEISWLTFKEQDEKDLFRWKAQSVLARFGDFGLLMSPENIVPEYSDRMIAVKISEGCMRNCGYCTEPLSKRRLIGMYRRPIHLYSKEMIEASMVATRTVQEKWHGPSRVMRDKNGELKMVSNGGHLHLMNEGFLNGSDILWHHLLEGGVSPIWIADRFMEIFPEVGKLYAFFGVPNVNKTSEKHLAALYNNAQRVNRALVGIESFDKIVSAFAGKNESPEEKRDAIKKLINAGFKTKLIIQLGMTGRRFFYRGEWHDSREGLKRTVEEIIRLKYEINKHGKVLISRNVPIKGTRLYKLKKQGMIKGYTKAGLEEEVEWFIGELRNAGINAEDNYQVAIRKR